MKIITKSFLQNNLYKFTLALVVVLFSLEKCEKPEIAPKQEPVTTEENNNSSFKMNALPTNKILYVTDYNIHLGDTAWENGKIRYALKKGFNRMAFYTIDGSSKLTGSNGTKVKSFISRMHANNLKMDICFSTASFCTGTLNTYMNGAAASEKFDGIRWESEYYHNNNFMSFKPELATAYNWAKSKSPAVTVFWYQSWLSNDCTWNYQFKEIAKNCDWIDFHDYRTAPQWSYVKPRADSAAKAWKDLINAGIKPVGSRLQAGIIASSESIAFGAAYEFSGQWFKTHTHIDFWTSVYSQHNSSLLVNENYINFDEMTVFMDKFYVQAQP